MKRKIIKILLKSIGDWKKHRKIAFHFLNSFNSIISYNTQFYGTNFYRVLPPTAGSRFRLRFAPAALDAR